MILQVFFHPQCCDQKSFCCLKFSLSSLRCLLKNWTVSQLHSLFRDCSEAESMIQRFSRVPFDKTTKNSRIKIFMFGFYARRSFFLPFPFVSPAHDMCWFCYCEWKIKAVGRAANRMFQVNKTKFISYRHQWREKPPAMHWEKRESENCEHSCSWGRRRQDELLKFQPSRF